VLQHDQAGDGRHGRAQLGPHHQRLVGERPEGAFGQTNYSAAKAGIHGFTKALALEVARKGVTVNTISPGYIGTKMVTAIPKEILDSKILPQIPTGRLGKPDEVAGLIIYLCSDEAAFVTGANISINGGQHMY
jgi:acetoacetyl-CoA reductase